MFGVPLFPIDTLTSPQGTRVATISNGRADPTGSEFGSGFLKP